VRLNTLVQEIEQKKDGFRIVSNNGNYTSGIVINSAGLYSDKIAAMVGINDYKIFPCAENTTFSTKIA